MLRQERLQLQGSAGLLPGVGSGRGTGLPLALTAKEGSAAIPQVPWGALGPRLRFMLIKPFWPKLKPQLFLTIHASAVYPTASTA